MFGAQLLWGDDNPGRGAWPVDGVAVVAGFCFASDGWYVDEEAWTAAGFLDLVDVDGADGIGGHLGAVLIEYGDGDEEAWCCAWELVVAFWDEGCIGNVVVVEVALSPSVWCDPEVGPRVSIIEAVEEAELARSVNED